jgi:SAM-dependent methyltransferase
VKKTSEEIKKYVRERYGGLAQEQAKSCCPPTSCCPPQPPATGRRGRAEQVYGRDQLAGLPDTVVEGSYGCGDPTAIADLKEGEVVLDLGSGGGIDCFLSAEKVGPGGRVIGLDMTPEMTDLARANAIKMGVGNVEFRLGEMEHMPVENGSVDVVISNCVINLSPDKDAVFREAFRVLRPGGRLCVSDIVTLGELPPDVKESMEKWAGCVAGALEKDDYLDRIRAAGFEEVSAGATEGWTPRSGAEGKLLSIKVRALKP